MRAVYSATASVTALLVAAATANAQSILYVKANATGTNDGTSWANAYNHLQTALGGASSGSQIWVAAGSYMPDGGRTPVGGAHIVGTRDRAATFQLNSGVALYGGFSGSETNLLQRNATANPTILSGDLDGDDGFAFTGMSENSYHVVNASGLIAPAIIDGFTITAGNANGTAERDFRGGGMTVESGVGPVVINCTFRFNRSDGGPAAGYSSGGPAAYFQSSASRFVNCTFQINRAVGSIDDGTGTTGNGLGGALFGSGGRLVNCVLVANSASFYGGGVAVAPPGNVALINCTSSRNGAMSGGGLYASLGTTGIAICNSISINEGPDVHNDSTQEILASYSCISGNAVGPVTYASCIFSEDLLSNPFIRTPDKGADNVWGTADDDYGDLRLPPGSIVIDAGNNDALPVDEYDLDGDGNTTEALPVDVVGNPRRVDDASRPDSGNGAVPLVDMGAYERAERFFLFTDPPPIREGGSIIVGVHLAWDPQRTVAATVAFASGDSDISVAAGTTLEFNSANYLQPQNVVLVAAEDADAISGIAVFDISATGFPPAQLTASELDNDASPTLYVNAIAAPGGDGSTWQTAFDNLESALSLARLTDAQYSEIWVAAGTYIPSDRTDPSNVHTKTFRLVNGVSVYGGFAGSETSLSQRDARANVTILSGDPGDFQASHVVSSAGNDATAVLDGFTIIEGLSFGTDVDPGGAGMKVVAGSQPTIRNCTFRHNIAIVEGGGLYSEAPLQLTNCTFVGNRGGIGGGASLHAGGTLVNCVFVDNVSTDIAGGLYVLLSRDSYVTNCTISGNRANSQGGGLHCDDGTLIPFTLFVDNCIIWNNSVNSHTIDNNGGPECWSSNYSTNLDISHSCVPSDGIVVTHPNHLSYGPGNILVNPPGFVRVPSAGPDGVWGTVDDDPGDLHLTMTGDPSSSSPCIDAGDNGAVDLGLDVDGNLRRFDQPSIPDAGIGVGAKVDMGAYESGSVAIPSRLYVQSSSSAGGTGISWADSLTDLRFALDTAAAAGGKVHEIWVAGGEHKPAASGGARDATFRLISGVAIYGGFSGMEASLAERDLTDPAHRSVLSGDLSGDDQPGFGNRGDNCYHVVTAGGSSAAAILDGFTIRGGNADGAISSAIGAGLYLFKGRPSLRNLRLVDNSATVEGAGVWSDLSRPQIDGLTIETNAGPVGDAGVLSRNGAILQGPLTLTGGTAVQQTLDLRSTQFDGPGGIRIGPNVVVQVSSAPSYDPVIFRTPVTMLSGGPGPGRIQIDLGQRLVLDGGAIVDLSGLPPGPTCADPSQASLWGAITVNGELVINSGTIQNTNVAVRVANLQNATNIINNDIRLVQSSAGFGGQFFVAPGATVRCNVITSEGDRYLDLDPDPNAVQRPTIQDNKFYVVIKQGTTSQQGELLELRTRDFECNAPACPSGAFQLAGSTGYSDTWTLDRLTVQSNAKVTLTNRQGFDYQMQSHVAPEALYVKDVVLSSGAILNTGLQRMYYQTLHDEFGGTLVRNPQNPSAPMSNGSRIVDVPLLGFSLGMIACDDDTEFSVRVRSRTRDPADVQPVSAPFKEGSVLRITGAIPDQPTNGVMQLKTQAADSLSASSVAAKGAFARAGEDEITIAFKYLFCGNTSSHLIVSISDQPDVGVNNVQIANIYVPDSGWPGSVGSSTLADFYATVPRGSLNFTRGLYVELELRGTNSCCLIDQWDPYICTPTCADTSGDNLVSNIDYLYLLSEFGQTVTIGGNESRSCLDRKVSADHFVDAGDLSAQDAYVAATPDGADSILNLCGDGSSSTSGSGSASAGSPVTPPNGALVIAGKPALVDSQSGQGVQHDMLYTLDATNGISVGSPLSPADATDGTGEHRGNGRLVRDSAGQIYQLNALQGVIRLSDAQPVITPGFAMNGGDTIFVGLTALGNSQSYGVPLVDVAFHPTDPTRVYVAPVLIQPASLPSCCPSYRYKAAAKLHLLGNGTYAIEKVYGIDPRNDPNMTQATGTTASCGTCQLPSDSSAINVHKPREIEVDSQGNVFVISAQSDNHNNWILVFDEASGAERTTARYYLGSSIDGPTAMLVSGNKLYLAPSVDIGDGSTTQVRRYSILRSGSQATGFAVDGVVTLNGMRHVTSLAEHPSTLDIWAVGFTAPTFDPYDLHNPGLFTDSSPIFTTPMRAVIPANATPPVTTSATPIAAFDLALPLGSVFTPPGAGCLRGDTNNDGQRNVADLISFVNVLLNGTNDPALYCRADLNADTSVDGQDIQPFVTCALSGTCP